MTKQEFRTMLAKIYAVGNLSDSDCAEGWTKPSMAGQALCAPLDTILSKLVADAVFTDEDVAWIYDNI